MLFRYMLWVLSFSFVIGTAVFADTLVLKDGRVVQGKYKKGTASMITFEADGKENSYPVETILTITFQRTSPIQSTSQNKTTPSVSEITLNAGTKLMIRTEMLLETGKVKEDFRFTSVLESDLVAQNIVVAAKGTKVYGKVVESKKARRVVGKARLVLELTDIMINNQLQPIMTSQMGMEGDKSGTLKKIGAGAIMGAAIDGSEGAEKGAIAGAGLAILTKGQQISLPSGTILEFQLKQPFTIQIKM